MSLEIDQLHTELFEALEIAVAINDLDGNLLYVNQKYADLIGYEKQEVLKISYWDVTPEKYIEQENVQLKSIKETGKYGPYIKEYIHKSGALIPVRLNGKIISIDGVNYLWSTVEDISSSKSTEHKLDIIFSQSQDALMTLGPPNWNFSSCNPATLKLFEVSSEEEFLSLGPWDVSPEKQPNGKSSGEMAKDVIMRAMEEGREFFEWTHKTINGKEIPCTVLLSRIDEGEKSYIQAVVRDISGQKELEKKLQDTNEYLDLALEGAGLGVWDWDLTNNSVRFDRRWAEMVGLKFEETPMELSTWESRVHPEDLENAYSDIKKYMDGKTEVYENIHRMKHENGHWVYIFDKGRFSKWDNEGNPIRFTGTHLDVTELKEKEKELEAALSEAKFQAEHAKKAEKAKAEFLANMSHEIRTPMNGIIGIIELLKDSGLNEEQKDLLETMELSGNNLLRIINDILDLSKIEAGKIDFELVQFDFISELSKCVELFKENAKQKGIKLKLIKSVNDLPLLDGDTTRIHQIILNLLSNAIKFTEKGSVEVELKAELSNQNSNFRKLNVIVRDTGIGIAENEKESLFQKFEQADTSITRKYGGSGLGLSISSKLAQLMGGEIIVNSELGKGSEFTFSISLAVSNERKGESKTVKLFEKLSSEYPHNILIVEDNEINQKVALRTFSKLGYECDIATNGKEAIDKVGKNNNEYTLIFMDMQMPIMDGIEATKTLVKMYQDQVTPIIAMTANVLAEDREICFEAGMCDFLGKPLQVDKVKDILKKYSK